MPVRFVLVYQGQRVPLPDGNTVVGRSLSCQVRFNAPTVSRQHLLLHVAGEDVTVENLSASTGTFLNGTKIHDVMRVHEGDELTLGPRQVRIERIDPDALARLPPMPTPALGLLQEGDDEEITLNEDVPVVPGPPPVRISAPHPTFHTCPVCRTQVAFHDRACPSCGHAWTADAPSQRLGQVTSPNFMEDIVMPAEVMAVYASDVMTVDATITELTRDGVFIPTELLDAPGTECEVTLLPDGQAPLSAFGTVIAARAPTLGRGPSGVEVRFKNLTDGVRLWIDLWAHHRGQRPR